ncbi:hypothetical protein KBI23_26525 [bacterium]|nr:hypothetical protein [bacterium]
MSQVENSKSCESELPVRKLLFILCRSFVIAAAILALSLVIFPPYFGSIDEVHLTMIVSGVGICPRPDCHIIFPNILLGKLLSWLYTEQNQFPWYGTFLCFANVCSFTLVLSVFSWERASLLRKILLGLFTVVSLLALWTCLTFTGAAIFLAAASMLVALSALECKYLTKSGKAIVLAVSLGAMLVAAIIRVDSARLILVLLAVVVCCRFARAQTAKTLVAGLAFWALLFSGVQLLDYVNSSYYESEPEWSRVARFNTVINKICDFRRLAYRPDTKKYFDSVGWNENDLNLISSYEYAIDPKLFSCEKAEQLLPFFPNFRSDLSLPMVAHQLLKYVGDRLVLPSLLLAIFLSFFVDHARLSRTRYAALFMAAIGVVLCLLCCMKLELRITMPLFASLALVSLYYCDDEKLLRQIRLVREVSRVKFSIGLCSVFVAVLVMCLNYQQSCSEASAGRAQLKQSCAALQRLNGSLYVIPSTVPLGLISPFESVREYFSSMRVLIPYFAVTPLVNYWVPREVQAQTRLPLLEPGVLLCAGDDSNRYKPYYLDHHCMKVDFEVCYADKLIRVYKAVPIGRLP